MTETSSTPPGGPTQNSPSAAGRRSLLRNPWFWGVIACLLYPPLVRPLTRHIPEPPPVSGQVPELTIQDHTGRHLPLQELTGTVHILGAFEGRNDGACPKAFATVQPLLERLEHQALAGRGCAAPEAGFGDAIRILLVSTPSSRQAEEPNTGLSGEEADGGATPELDGSPPLAACGQLPKRLSAAALSPEQAQPLIKLLSPPSSLPASEPPLRTELALTLLDETGGVRGLYSTDELGLDEVYHRARHILRSQRIEARHRR